MAGTAGTQLHHDIMSVTPSLDDYNAVTALRECLDKASSSVTKAQHACTESQYTASHDIISWCKRRLELGDMCCAVPIYGTIFAESEMFAKLWAYRCTLDNRKLRRILKPLEHALADRICLRTHLQVKYTSVSLKTDNSQDNLRSTFKMYLRFQVASHLTWYAEVDWMARLLLAYKRMKLNDDRLFQTQSDVNRRGRGVRPQRQHRQASSRVARASSSSEIDDASASASNEPARIEMRTENEPAYIYGVDEPEPIIRAASRNKMPVTVKAQRTARVSPSEWLDQGL